MMQRQRGHLPPLRAVVSAHGKGDSAMNRRWVMKNVSLNPLRTLALGCVIAMTAIAPSVANGPEPQTAPTSQSAMRASPRR
jgi:hypothetical protein